MIPPQGVDAWVANSAPDTIIGRLRDDKKVRTAIPAEAGWFSEGEVFTQEEWAEFVAKVNAVQDD